MQSLAGSLLVARKASEGEGELHFAVRSNGVGTQVNLDGLAEQISGMASPSFA
jgi:hypothetical protein